jgi:hypothetical protein
MIRHKIQTEFVVYLAESGVLTGGMMLFGVPYIVAAVLVEDIDGRQVAVNDPLGYLETLNEADPDIDGSGRMTCQIPGHEGDWVLVITPPFRKGGE